MSSSFSLLLSARVAVATYHFSDGPFRLYSDALRLARKGGIARAREGLDIDAPLLAATGLNLPFDKSLFEVRAEYRHAYRTHLLVTSEYFALIPKDGWVRIKSGHVWRTAATFLMVNMMWDQVQWCASLLGILGAITNSLGGRLMRLTWPVWEQWGERDYTANTGARKAGEGVATKTRSEAWVLSGHTAVVMVEGVSGCVALEAVRPLGAASRQHATEGV